MRPWLRRSLLILAVFALCWGGAIWYWRTSTRMPSTGDLAGSMLALPLALLISWWLGKKLVTRLAAPAAVPALFDAADADAGAPGNDPAPRAPLHLAAAALRMPGGASAPELAAALLDKQQRPELDPELTDAQGYPVMSARVADLDEHGQRALLDDWLQTRPADTAPGAAPHFDAEHLRALALGAEVLTELMQEAAMHAQLDDYQAAQPGSRAVLPLPTLQLHLLLPPDWNKPQRDTGAAWLHGQAQQQGWPADKLSVHLAGDSGPLALIEQLAAQAALQELPCLAIVLACGSHIGELTVHDWTSRGLLFNAGQPSGQIPGEGAAGLLLADAAQAAALQADTPVLLHHASMAVRGQSADGRSHGDATLLAELGGKAMSAASVAPDAITRLYADADQRSSRMIELMNNAGTLLPDIDLSNDVLSVAAACGQSGHVATLAALVLARHEAAENASQVLCLSNLDAFHRAAVVVGPEALAPESLAAT
ncbi:hypothetical protein [Janthinobacterium lividum]|uniref:hypothetical protein n=1 Tax=Janthinobacterium lividum TaxID=29581 RepID=UPI00087488DF|nr:hypothetical protein [Janthinobacterium lividum]MCC7712982.1 hypothetical protein [Janthinobacterium lividum]OEZ57495.1 hypothetical protein JANLI_26220 [Janthinobacterium lividum]WQE31419.1 hypothetical protein U0004_13710 [Janthinobacterium lividum]STQ96947.1 Uncharacterised protein [Janthinobacterium lividum]